jgi:hypothetical protein
MDELFVWSYPLYVAQTPKRAGFIGFVSADRVWRLGLWTDLDLIERYLKSATGTEAVPFVIDDRVTLKIVLHDVMRLGVSEIAVDPVSGSSADARTLPLHYFLAPPKKEQNQ